MSVFSWIHIIESRDQYNRIESFTFNEPKIMMGSYLIIEGSVVCSDGRILGRKGKKNIAIATNTIGRDPIDKMVDEGIIDFKSTASFDDLLDEELELTGECALIKKATYLKGFSEFEKYF